MSMKTDEQLGHEHLAFSTLADVATKFEAALTSYADEMHKQYQQTWSDIAEDGYTEGQSILKLNQVTSNLEKITHVIGFSTQPFMRFTLGDKKFYVPANGTQQFDGVWYLSPGTPRSIEGGTVTPNIAPSSNYGTVIAPAAGAAIVASSLLPPGTYQVTANAWYGSTSDVADNMQIAYQSAAGTFPTIRLAVPSVINGTPIPRTVTITTGGGNSVISIQAMAAGAVNSVYKATLDITPLSSGSSSTFTPVAGSLYLGLFGKEVPYGKTTF